MRKLYLIISFLLCAILANAQKQDNYFVIYRYTNEVMRMPGNRPLSMLYYMIANADSSKLFYRRTKKPKSSIDDFQIRPGRRMVVESLIIMPDSQFYKQGRWITLMDDKWTPNITYKMEFTETGQTRKILGYQCSQFVATDSAGNQLVRVWATKELPGTLIPMVGLEYFPYGILEIRHLAKGWKLLPRRVKKLK